MQEYKLYDVYDTENEDFLIERATSQEISDELDVENSYVRQCIYRKYRIKKRYLVTPSEPVPSSLLLMWDNMIAGLHKEVIGK